MRPSAGHGTRGVARPGPRSLAGPMSRQPPSHRSRSPTRSGSVFDPELSLSVVDLGLIYDVGIKGAPSKSP